MSGISPFVCYAPAVLPLPLSVLLQASEFLFSLVGGRALPLQPGYFAFVCRQALVGLRVRYVKQQLWINNCTEYEVSRIFERRTQVLKQETRRYCIPVRQVLRLNPIDRIQTNKSCEVTPWRPESRSSLRLMQNQCQCGPLLLYFVYGHLSDISRKRVYIDRVHSKKTITATMNRCWQSRAST